MRPNLQTFALLGAIGSVLGGVLGELWMPPPAIAPAQPAAIALVLDASGSMDDFNKLDEVKRAARGFVQRQDLQQTPLAVIGFGSEAHLESPLTSDAAALLAAIERIQDGGGTMMAEGLTMGIESLNQAQAGPRAILLFTDGVPGSTLMPDSVAREQALAVAREARIQGIGLVAVGTEDADMDFLAQLTGSHQQVFSTQSGRFDQAFRLAESSLKQIFGGKAQSPVLALQEAFFRGGLVALGLGLLLLLGQNLLTLRGRWQRDLLWVPVGTALLGGLAALVGQVSVSLLDSTRSFGWAILGAGTGLFLGMADRSRAKALRGALGGAVGGALGGWMFELLLGVGNSSLARLAGFAVLGAAIGLMVQWVQQAFKTAWLVGLTTGPYEGKEYILAKVQLTLGRSDANDIGLYHEKDLPPHAGVLRLEQGRWIWEGQPIGVNGRTLTHQTLRSGDRLRFGATEFMLRVKGESPQTANQAWALFANQTTYALPIPFRESRIGSATDNSVVIPGTAPQHALLRLEADGFSVLALSPLEVNGEALKQGQSKAIVAGDLLRLNGIELAFSRRR